MKRIKFFLLLSLTVCLSSLMTIDVSSSVSSFDLVDNEDDVMEINWNEESGEGTYKFVTDKPNIDILGVDYELSSVDEILLTITVKGEIQVENSYYWVIINSEEFQIDVWFGAGWSAASESKITGFDYSNGSQFVEGSVSYVISGSELKLALGKNSDQIIFPSEASNNWKWQVSSWTGTDSQQNVGSWYLDYAPDSENKYTGVLSLQTANGFELSPMIFGLLVVTIGIFYKRNAKHKI